MPLVDRLKKMAPPEDEHEEAESEEEGPMDEDAAHETLSELFGMSEEDTYMAVKALRRLLRG